MNKNEIEICEFEEFMFLFTLSSDNDDIIST